jgi:hypothetical protein
MEEYQQKLDRLDRQYTDFKKWICLCLFGLILTPIWGVCIFIFLIVVSIYAYIFMKQLLKYNIDGLISDRQVGIFLIVGLIALIAIIDLI